MKCVLLGAGASKGYGEKDDNNETIPEIFQPPLTWEIVLRAVRMGMISEQNYPNLHGAVQDYLIEEEEYPIPEETELWILSDDILSFDMESFLAWVLAHSSGLPSEHSGPENDAQNLSQETIERRNKAVGEVFQFIYDFFRLYLNLYFSEMYDNVYGKDNYLRLLNELSDDEYWFISLNYDLILESALEHIGESYHYGLRDDTYAGEIPIMKVHGSINWLYPKMGFTPDNLHHRGMEYGNIFVGQSGPDQQRIRSLTLSEVKQSSSQELPPLRLFFELPKANWVPSLVPPFADSKDHIPPFGDRRGLDSQKLNRIKENCKSLLSCTDELIIIGCSLREDDSIIWSLLKNHLNKNASVSIACGGKSEDIKESLEEELDTSPDTYGRFHDYLNEIERQPRE